MIGDKEVKKKYSKIAKEYDETRFSGFGGRLLDKKQKKVLLSFLKNIKKKAKILEVGCGTGRFLEFLEKKGYENLYGIDPSKEMLNLARKKTKAVLRKADAYKLPFKSNSFDVVFSVHVLMHLSKPKKAIKDMIRVSKNIIIFDIMNRNSFSYVASKIFKGYKPRFSSLKEIKQMIPEYKIKYKPTYMFPLKGHFIFLYYIFALSFEKIAFLLQLKRLASQLFLQIEK